MAQVIGSFIRLSRPHFLVGGVLLFAYGATSAPVLDAGVYLVAQLMVTSSQLTAHYVNEYADSEVDKAVVNRTWFSGGSGVLSSDALEPRVALRAGVVTSAISVVVALVVLGASVWAGILGLVTLLVSWTYSMPPIRLLGTGFGEAVTSVTVAGLVPVIGATAMGVSPPAALWWGIGVLVPVHMAMMLAFELPDLDSDATTGKRVLAVRLGAGITRRVIALLLVSAGVVGILGDSVGSLDGGVVVGAVAALPVFMLLRAAQRSRHSLTTLLAVGIFVTVSAGLLALNLA